MSHILADTDRRCPRREDRAEALADFFHSPEATQDDPLHERARLAAHRFASGRPMSREDWSALKAEATLWAGPLSPLPEF